MKRYTPKIVSKWIAAANLVSKHRPAKPFPGQAPTRIMLRTIAGKRTFEYIGKPSRDVYRAYVNFCDKPYKGIDFHTVYVEFDRSGIVTFSHLNNGNVPKRSTNMELWAHYHPEIVVENLPNWLRYSYKVVKSTYKLA